MDEYEIWRFGPIFPEGRWGWTFRAQERLTLKQVFELRFIGYGVVKVSGDRSGTIPLFPVLEGSYYHPEDWLDQMPVSGP